MCEMNGDQVLISMLSEIKYPFASPYKAAINVDVRKVVARGLFQRLLSQFTVNNANGKMNKGSFILIVASPSLKFSVQNRPKTVQMNKAVRAVKIVLLGL